MVWCEAMPSGRSLSRYQTLLLPPLSRYMNVSTLCRKMRVSRATIIKSTILSTHT
jgi:hypothetical protein